MHKLGSWKWVIIPVSLLSFISCDTNNGNYSGVVTSIDLHVNTEGDTVIATISAEDARDLYGAAIDLVYDFEALEYESASEGDLIKSGGGTNFLSALENDEPGRVVLGDSLIGNVSGVDGSGDIARIYFNKRSDFSSFDLHLERVVLVNSNGEIITSIDLP